MFRKIFHFTKKFGLVNGISLYLNRKYNRSSAVKFPFLKHPVHFRGQISKSDLIMFEQIFYTKEYDINVPFEPKVIIDLGANVGFASVYFANRFPASKIFALEPNKENYDLACKNVKKYPNIKMVMGAIWNRSEEIHLVDKGYGEASFMIEPGTDINSIQAYTIRSVMKMMNTDFIDILKIDIEGSEKEIFESGYEEWLSLTKIIIVETHDRYKKGSSKSVLSTISNYNFSLELSAENLVFYNNNLINPY